MYERGDIIRINFDPSAGQEIQKRRPAFVVSRRLYTKKTGLVIVVPITSTIRGWNTEIILPDSTRVQGSVLTHQIRSFDVQARHAEFIEKAPMDITDSVMKLVRLYFS